MTGIEGRMGVSAINSLAIKPVAGFIDALLAPKIEKAKVWANEKELDGQIEPDKLAKVMAEYLEKLSLRVSEITSLAFPQLKLDIFAAYEPLILGKLHYNNSIDDNEVYLSKLIDENIQSCIIIDNAGMGKSTFSKYIVASLIMKSDRIPLFFELRKINKELDLIENLAKELDFPGKGFNRSLFYKLLQLGKFYVIIDGFDEVELDYQETLANQIHELSIKGGDNIILLTSRPQDTLPNILNSETLKFKPFSNVQAIALLERYDYISGLSVGADLTAQIDKVPQKFIESPLLVSLLYKTFGFNKSIAEKTSTFYAEIYDALYKGHDLINKNGYAREKKSELDFEDFKKLVRALSYYMMLNKKTSFMNRSEATTYIEKAIEFCSITPSSASNFLDDLLVSVPLMNRDGTEIKFLHKTLLEYFCAEYILFDNSSSELLKKLFESKLAPSFDKTFEFLFELDSSLFDGVITHHFATKAKEIFTEGNFLEQVLNNLIFTRQCKISLWKKRDSDVNIRDEHEFNRCEKLLLSEGYTYFRWNDCCINDDIYHIALTFKDVPSNFHTCAWQSISTIVNTDDIFTEELSENDIIILQQVLGTNNWNDLSFDIITKIKSITSILDLTYSELSSNNYNERGIRILSKEKINAILEKVKKEEEYTKELAKFLL